MACCSKFSHRWDLWEYVLQISGPGLWSGDGKGWWVVIRQTGLSNGSHGHVELAKPQDRWSKCQINGLPIVNEVNTKVSTWTLVFTLPPNIFRETYSESLIWVWLTYEGGIFRSHVRKLCCPIWLPPATIWLSMECFNVASTNRDELNVKVKRVSC